MKLVKIALFKIAELGIPESWLFPNFYSFHVDFRKIDARKLKRAKRRAQQRNEKI